MLYSQDEQFSFKEFFSKKPIIVWLFIVILSISGFGLGFFGVYTIFDTTNQEIVSSNDIESQVCEQSADFGQITVYISGAVVNPGVYILQTGDRVVDLLESAGGISSSADKVYINKQFNLAQVLSDSEQFYIPTKAETEGQLVAMQNIEVVSLRSSKKQNGELVAPASERLISINSSPQNVLMQLLGIGEVRATKIIENRPFNSLQELVEKGVISQSLFDEIESQISL